MGRRRTDTPKFSLTTRNKLYYVTYWQNNRQHFKALKVTDLEQAKRLMAEFAANTLQPTKPPSVTIAAILEGYKCDRSPRVASVETLRHSCGAVSRKLGALRPELLTRERCRAYAIARRQEGRRGATGAGKPLSDGTIIRELTTLRAALAWAVGEGWIAAPPYVEVPATPHPRERWLTRDEAEKLFTACERDKRGSHHVKVFLSLALYTAGRAGALLELTWDRVDFSAGIINLGKGVGNKRRAVVPMGAKLRAVLLEAAEIRTTDRVVEFHGRSVASVRHAFREAVTGAGLAGRVTPHTLRHTAATWMVQSGTPLAQVARFLGDSEEMVEKVYGHHSPDYLRAASAALEG